MGEGIRVDSTCPRVTVLVLNWCGEEVTRECITSLLHSDYENFSLLLIDNSSPDGSGDRLHADYPAIPFIQTGENLGYAGGNNRGIERALADGSDYVLILNNDTVVEPTALRMLVEAAEAGERVGAVAPKILFYDRPDRIWFGGGTLSRIRAVGRHRHEGELDGTAGPDRVQQATFLSGCCLLVPSKVLQEVGGFQEDFFAYVEDVELSLRLTERGYDLLYQPQARILHHSPPVGAPPSPFQIFLRDRNRRWVAQRRYGVLDRLLFRSFFYSSRLVLMGAYAARRDWARTRALWRGMTEN